MRSDLEIRLEYTRKIQNSEIHVEEIDTKSLKSGYFKTPLLLIKDGIHFFTKSVLDSVVILKIDVVIIILGLD